MNYRVPLAILIGIVSCVSCTTKDQKASKSKNGELPITEFVVPEIPVMISSPEQQASYLLEHYWDNYNFKDTSDLGDNSIIERAFIDYLMILDQVNDTEANSGISRLIKSASSNEKLSLYFFEKAEKYLYHPNSPVRNENLYEKFLKEILSSELLEPIAKVRYQYQFDTAQKNKPGNKATNFEYSLKNGSLSNLYDTEAEFLLLYFHNPDCHECAASKERIVNSQIISELSKRKLLKIMAIYPDEDLDLWNNHYDDMPVSWINAYDKGTVIMNEELYDLKAIPTLYLLDQHKIVLLRDPSFEQIETYLKAQ